MEFRDPSGAHRLAGIPVIGRTIADQTVQDEDVAGVIFQDCVFERVRLERVTLTRTMFVNSRFDDCVFQDCGVEGTVWSGCLGSGIRIAGGAFSYTIFSQCKFVRLDFEQAGYSVTLSESAIDQLSFSGAARTQNTLTISDCALESVLAENAEWTGATAVGVQLANWSLAGGHFTRCSFIGVIGEDMDLSDVRFEACNLYQSKFPKARFRSAERCIFAECDLRGADLADAALAGALFVKAEASDASFERAQLDGAMFPKAKLAGSCFSQARAHVSVWIDADLSSADLSGLDAWRGVFRNAILRGAEVVNARLVEADLHGVRETLAGADLQGARGTVEWRAEREEELRRQSENPTGE